jgi:hypothetical protein
MPDLLTFGLLLILVLAIAGMAHTIWHLDGPATLKKELDALHSATDRAARRTEAVAAWETYHRERGARFAAIRPPQGGTAVVDSPQARPDSDADNLPLDLTPARRYDDLE